ncbi:hypothetical protein [Pseudoalteromonas luteoviolacea]|uniref:Tetratricopeptide repeat protein n=1 Tax=Pseudoalteromonas luteoviolacea (strain 2ta16) TaxID=1353533 RepID=V4HZ22_PSEL2|nr:hypothetical protein [Pseudoalteromonas luteoviolacea]ESP95043.1 hypothetical protein PL2TA16_04599 [Pseudoalteromonas luteoviolacea 2ta16]KZN34153.1 hypothetical protein N483_25400 [Pseudoalteromonas luteoviolacea NCIMB 1944]
MKKAIMAILITASVTCHAEEVKKAIDPFDLTASSSKVKELGLITQPEVDALEEKAKNLFSSGNCDKAIPVLIEYSKKANWLANMISATLDPYYGARYDDKKKFPYSKLKPLIPLETLANEYKQKRNIAFAMQGECLMKVGDNEKAIPLLLKALDLFGIENEVWWKRTRENLLNVINVSSPK